MNPKSLTRLVEESTAVATGANAAVPRQSKPSVQDFMFLLSKVKMLFDLPETENIYRFIAVSLSEFLNSSVVFVSSYDQPKNIMKVQGLAGLGGYTEKIVHMIGSNPAALSTPMTEDCRRGLVTSKFTNVGGGIYELANHSLPKIVCSGVEEFIGIRYTYAMGLTWHDRILGSVAVLSRVEIRDSAVIETFINYAALAVRQRLEKENNPADT
ncbi:MAG: hypothetical protein PHR56_00820 [Dehalococcoidales bacterium]|nr:hypothetical protein [Dehalococcoidales bacterium]